MCCGLNQAVSSQQACTLNQTRFGAVRLWQHDGVTRFMRRNYRRQRSRNGAQFSPETQFAEVFSRQIRYRGFDLTGGGQDTECNRQVKAAAVLGNIGGRKIHGNPASGKIKARIDQRTAYAFPAFPDRGLGKADDGE